MDWISWAPLESNGLLQNHTTTYPPNAMIACGRSMFSRKSVRPPVATGKSGPSKFEHVFGSFLKRHLVKLRKGPAKGPGKGPAKGPPAENYRARGPKFWWFFLMDGLNIWWDSLMSFLIGDLRYPWILKDLLGWIPFFVFFFWRWQNSLDQMSFFITKIFGCFVFSCSSLSKHGISMYFQMTCLESERWLYMIVQSNPVQHMVGWTLANKTLVGLSASHDKCDFNILSFYPVVLGSCWQMAPLMFPLQSPKFQSKHGPTQRRSKSSWCVLPDQIVFGWVREFRVF